MANKKRGQDIFPDLLSALLQTTFMQLAVPGLAHQPQAVPLPVRFPAACPLLWQLRQ
jgi:hypothetical protein